MLYRPQLWLGWCRWPVRHSDAPTRGTLDLWDEVHLLAEQTGDALLEEQRFFGLVLQLPASDPLGQLVERLDVRSSGVERFAVASLAARRRPRTRTNRASSNRRLRALTLRRRRRIPGARVGAIAQHEIPRLAGPPSSPRAGSLRRKLIPDRCLDFARSLHRGPRHHPVVVGGEVGELAGRRLERVAEAPVQAEQVDVGDRVPAERPRAIRQAPIRDAEHFASEIGRLSSGTPISWSAMCGAIELDPGEK